MQFYKVLNTECDFCKEMKKVVTQVDDIYICKKCATLINKHCIANEYSIKKKKEDKIG